MFKWLSKLISKFRDKRCDEFDEYEYNEFDAEDDEDDLSTLCDINTLYETTIPSRMPYILPSQPMPHEHDRLRIYVEDHVHYAVLYDAIADGSFETRVDAIVHYSEDRSASVNNKIRKRDLEADQSRGMVLGRYTTASP